MLCSQAVTTHLGKRCLINFKWNTSFYKIQIPLYGWFGFLTWALRKKSIAEMLLQQTKHWMLSCQMSIFYLHMCIFYSTDLLKKRKHPFLIIEALERSLYCVPKYSKAVYFLEVSSCRVHDPTISFWQILAFLKLSQKYMYVEEDRYYNCEWLLKIIRVFLKKLLDEQK